MNLIERYRNLVGAFIGTILIGLCIGVLMPDAPLIGKAVVTFLFVCSIKLLIWADDHG